MMKELLAYVADEASLTVGTNMFLGLRDCSASMYVCAINPESLTTETDGTDLGSSLVLFIAYSKELSAGSTILETIEQLLANRSGIQLATKTLQSVTGGSPHYEELNQRGYHVHVLPLRITTKRR